MKKNEDEDEKNEIENKIIDELKNKLENFDINKVILKNGKYYDNYTGYLYVHDENFVEYIFNNIIIWQSDIFQEIKNNIIDIQKYGKHTDFEDNYKGEIFYNHQIGKGKFSNEENEKFWFLFPNKNKLNEIENNDMTIILFIQEKITID